MYFKMRSGIIPGSTEWIHRLAGYVEEYNLNS